MNEYKTVNDVTVFTTVIEKSKFICRISPISDEESAKQYLASVVKAETGATHNCYAYVLEGETFFKFSDDGEPHGTAGQPILDVLKGYGLKNVIAVVTRYFGGIKLGTGGLSRAYSLSVKNCIEKAKIVQRKLCSVFIIKFDYNSYAKVSPLFNADGVKVLSTDFDNGVTVEFAVVTELENDFISKISSTLNKKLSINKKESKYLTF